MRPSVNQWFLILASILLVSVGVSILLTKFVHQRPEVELCREFLKNNSDIFPSLGNIKSITYEKQAVSRVSFKKEKTVGFYCFNVCGEMRETDVRVFWENRKQSDNFDVTRVEKLNKGEEPITLWSADN